MKTLIQIYDFLRSIAADKLLHSYISLIICSIVIAITNNYFISFVITLGIGFIKELVDFIRYGFKDQHKDLIADVIGAIVAILIIVIQ